MATTIDNILKSQNEANITFNKDKYNGVDVSKTKRQGNTFSRKQLVRYITKYVTKNDTVLQFHNAWHCSRIVSQLFTSVCVDVDFILNMPSYNPNSQVFATTTNPDIYLFTTYPNIELKHMFADLLFSVNEYVIQNLQ